MGGNWGGAQIGYAIGTLNAEITDVAVLSHELSGRLISSKWSYGPPDNLGRAETVLAVQFLLAAQGIDLARPLMGDLPMAKATTELHHRFRQHVPVLGEDRWMTPDVETTVGLVARGELLPNGA